MTIPEREKNSFDIGLKNIQWRTTNNFMLLGVRLFLFIFWKFICFFVQNGEIFSTYIVEIEGLIILDKNKQDKLKWKNASVNASEKLNVNHLLKFEPFG